MSDKVEKRTLPLFFDIEDKPCLVVGGGEVAFRKVTQLVDAGGKITVIAPQIKAELQEILVSGGCRWLQRTYESPEAGEYRLVIATTDDPPVNKQIFRDCNSRGVPVNVVDQPELCSVIFPSIIRRGFITTAISSGGKAPFLTKELRKRMELFLDDIEVLEFSDLLLTFRDFVRSNTDDFSVKKKLYQRLLECDSGLWAEWSDGDPPYNLWRQWIEEENAR